MVMVSIAISLYFIARIFGTPTTLPRSTASIAGAETHHCCARLRRTPEVRHSAFVLAWMNNLKLSFTHNHLGQTAPAGKECGRTKLCLP